LDDGVAEKHKKQPTKIEARAHLRKKSHTGQKEKLFRSELETANSGDDVSDDDKKQPANSHRFVLRRKNSGTGPVVMQFEDISQASNTLGFDKALIGSWCRENALREDYYWSFADSNTGADQYIQLGKRLRIRRWDNCELYGTVDTCIAATGHHVVRFDCDLSTAEFEWAEDGFQPVEKVCLQSGKVLQTYDSSRQAAKDVGCRREKLDRCLASESPKCRGFF
jgi:hypothetical protein